MSQGLNGMLSYIRTERHLGNIWRLRGMLCGDLTWAADKSFASSLCPLQATKKEKRVDQPVFWLEHASSQASSTNKSHHPRTGRITHCFAQVSDAPDLKGSRGLGGVELEVHRRGGYFSQGKALPHRSGHMKRLLGLHLTVEQTSMMRHGLKREKLHPRVLILHWVKFTSVGIYQSQMGDRTTRRFRTLMIFKLPGYWESSISKYIYTSLCCGLGRGGPARRPISVKHPDTRSA